MALRSNYLRQLQAFCETAQTGSISKAADRLTLTQPTVSQLIRTLERDINTELFDRHGPNIKLNEAGRLMLESALPLVQGVEQLPDLLQTRLGEATTGRVDIAAGESTILYLLPECVKRYKNEYPGVDLHLHSVTGRDGMQMLRAGEADFVIGSILEIPKDIVYVPMYTYPARVITPVDHPLVGCEPLELEEVSRYDLILPPRHLTTWHVIDLVFGQHGLNYRIALETGGWEVVKRFVELGIGISIITSICLRGDENLASMSADRWFPRRTYGAVTRRGRVLSPQARAFLKLFDPDFEQHLASAEAETDGHGRPRRGDDRSDPDLTPSHRPLV